MSLKQEPDWQLLPGSERDIAALRAHCRAMVRRRALLSAGLSALPIPGLDLLGDMRLFSLLIDDINQAFGLSAAQVARLRPRQRVLAYETALGVGGVLVGKLVTRELLLQLLRRTGAKSLARQAGKLVPVAGQLTAAALGFALFRQIGNQHVEACAAVARELLAAEAAASPSP